VDQAQALVQAQPRGTQRRASIVGQRTAHGQAIPAHHLGLGIGPSLHRTLKRAHPAHPLLELFLGVAICFEERACGLAQVVELAELVRHARQLPRHSVANRMLSIRENPGHGDR